MTELREDSTGPSPLIQGNDLISWRLLKTKFNLVDALSILGQVNGSRFTWRRRRGDRLDQSRLDRFYFSNGGWWTELISELAHIGSQALSDHDPILIRFRINPTDSIKSSKRKGTYFKANPAILKVPGNMEKLQASWEAHSSNDLDPMRRFYMSCCRLRECYKGLQQAPQDRDTELESLRERLCTLKTSIMEESDLELLQEFSNTESHLKDLEEHTASTARRFARIKWLGQGEEPSKFYFALVKAKQK